MNNHLLLNFIDLLAITLQLLIIVRVIMSWLRPNPTSPIGRFLLEVTDPILKPFQMILPSVAGLDFSPILALITIQVLQSLAQNYL
ncbi:YggT family protein [Patescibacteria group bacterium]|nr:YggT family protein [Patescibacteria group bacterium]